MGTRVCSGPDGWPQTSPSPSFLRPLHPNVVVVVVVVAVALGRGLLLLLLLLLLSQLQLPMQWLLRVFRVLVSRALMIKTMPAMVAVVVVVAVVVAAATVVGGGAAVGGTDGDDGDGER